MLSPGVAAFRLRLIPPPGSRHPTVSGIPGNAGHLGLDTLLRLKAEDSNYSPASEEASS